MFTPLHAFSGVPQGSILGPLLFLLFINDISRVCDSPLLLYADDTKIWRHIQSPNDCIKLQNDLDALLHWSSENHLPFNWAKTKVLHVRHKGGHVYSLNGHDLTEVADEKDLGTIVSADLGQTKNTRRMVSTAQRKLGMLHRVMEKVPKSIFPRLFGALVRPHLEVNIQACAPMLKADILAMEAVQRRATKRLFVATQPSYAERLEILDMFPLAYRRLRGDLILCYRALTMAHHPLRSFLTLASTINLRGNGKKLEILRPRLNCRKYSFFVRVRTPWNALPSSVVTAPNLDEFKSRLDKWLLPRWTEDMTEINA